MGKVCFIPLPTVPVPKGEIWEFPVAQLLHGSQISVQRVQITWVCGVVAILYFRGDRVGSGAWRRWQPGGDQFSTIKFISAMGKVSVA